MFLTFLRRIISVFLITVMFIGANFFGIMKEQYESVCSVTEIEKGFYTMNYTYDYDIDKIMEEGVSTNIGLILNGLFGSVIGQTKGPGCTTFNSVTVNGDYLFSRNFDYMDCDYILVWTHPKNGYASVSSVSAMFNGYDQDYTPSKIYDRAFTMIAPYCPFDGINEKGLSIGVLELEKYPTYQVTERQSLTTTSMIRAVLDKAATLEEAIAIFKKYDMRDPLVAKATYHYQIADASGKTAVVEYVYGKMNIIYPQKRQNSKIDYLAAANYFLTEGVYDPKGMGYDRVKTVYDALDASCGITSPSEAMDLLKATSIKNENLHGYICDTIWSAVYNQTQRTVDICYKNNFDKVYSFSVYEPQVIK